MAYYLDLADSGLGGINVARLLERTSVGSFHRTSYFEIINISALSAFLMT